MSINHDFEAEVQSEYESVESDRRDQEGYTEDELIGIEQITNRAYRNGARFFVRSSSLSSKFYSIQDGTCQCKGFQFRGDCQHLRHLMKEGWLVEDLSNGFGYRVADGVAEAQVSRNVVTGESVVPEDAGPVAHQLGGQVVRLQDLLKAQDRLIVAQRRLIGTMRNNSSQQMFFRALSAMEVEEQNVRSVEKALRSGDAVELDI